MESHRQALAAQSGNGRSFDSFMHIFSSSFFYESHRRIIVGSESCGTLHMLSDSPVRLHSIILLPHPQIKGLFFRGIFSSTFGSTTDDMACGQSEILRPHVGRCWAISDDSQALEILKIDDFVPNFFFFLHDRLVF